MDILKRIEALREMRGGDFDREELKKPSGSAKRSDTEMLMYEIQDDMESIGKFIREFSPKAGAQYRKASSEINKLMQLIQQEI